jgi:hypothetical protein
MSKSQNEKEGGKKAQLTGTLGETLALAYLQRRYPGTMIRRNPAHENGTFPHDIEQITHLDFASERTGQPFSLVSRKPERVWEVKGIRRTSKSFLINPNAHKRLVMTRTRKGASYMFVLFSTLDHSEREHSRSLSCQYRMLEIPAHSVERRFLRKAKLYAGQWKIPYYWIFSTADQSVDRRGSSLIAGKP